MIAKDLFSIKKIVASLIVFAGFSVVFLSGHAKAAYANLPTYLPEDSHQYINLTNSCPNFYVNGSCPGPGANITESFVKVYTDNNNGGAGTKQLHLHIVDRRAGAEQACQNYSIGWMASAVDANDERPVSLAGAGSQFISSCGDEYINIPNTMFVLSNKPSHEGIYVGILRFYLIPNSANPHTATFRLNTMGDARIGYVGGYNVLVYPSLSNSSNADNGAPLNYRDDGSGPYRNNHTISARFRPECGDNIAKKLEWLDDDKNVRYQQDNRLSLEVPEYAAGAPPPGGASTGNSSLNTINYSGSGVGSAWIFVRTGYIYDMRFLNVWGGNGISIKYPYDSGDFYLPCPGWNVDLSSSVDSPWTEIGTDATFTHIIKDAGGTTTNPNFTTRRANLNYPPAASANISGVVDLLSSTANPKQWTVNDSGQGTHTIPITGLGVDYCQSYTVDPKESNNGSATYGEYSTTFNGNTCTRGVGGFSKPVSKQGTPGLIEGGEKLSFAANVGTRSFTTFGTWVGYKTNCSFKLIRVTPAGAESDIPGTTGNCTRDIRADGEGTDVIVRYDVPADEPIGNKICLSVSIDSAIGQAGNRNPSLIDTLSPNPAKDGCNRVTAKPFLRSYLGDVISGGMFGATGTQGAGNIKAYLKDNEAIYPNPHAGSGVEFAAIAAGVIDNFASANMRNLAIATLPKPTNGLSFYNAGNAGGAIGKSIPTDRKVKDFFKETKTVPTFTSQAGGNYNISSKEGQEWVKNTSSNLIKISGSANKRFALYVEGDVLIDNDIKYPPSNYNNKDAIPYFSLVVKGNIYIKSPAVTQIDGLYIAQPQDESGGENNKADTGVIYTCAEKDTAPYVYSSAALYTNCEHRLTINGGFIAQNVKFLRTNGTQRDIGYDAGDPGSDPSPGIDDGDLMWAYSDAEKTRLQGLGKSNCIKMEEALGTRAAGGYGTWEDNYLCSSRNYGLKFYDGGINGTRDPGNTAEQCSRSFSVPLTPNYNPLVTISGNHPIAVAISNITWENDNYLCASAASNAQIELYTGTGTPTGKQCIQIIEDSDIQWTSDKNRKVCYHVKDTGGAGYRAPSWEQVNRNNPHIAEQFILTPEVLIGDPAFKPKPKGDPDNGRYDSIITLPPVL